MKIPLSTDQAPMPKGPYSQGIVTAGRQLYISAQGPFNPTNGDVVGGTIEEQTTRTLDNIKAIVDASGASMADVVKLTVYLADMSHFPAMNAIYRRYFPEPFPARTTVQSSLPGYLIAIDAIVALPEEPTGTVA